MATKKKRKIKRKVKFILLFLGLIMIGTGVTLSVLNIDFKKEEKKKKNLKELKLVLL